MRGNLGRNVTEDCAAGSGVSQVAVVVLQPREVVEAPKAFADVEALVLLDDTVFSRLALRADGPVHGRCAQMKATTPKVTRLTMVIFASMAFSLVTPPLVSVAVLRANAQVASRSKMCGRYPARQSSCLRKV